jgi:preprotein translocase subunit SecD
MNTVRGLLQESDPFRHEAAAAASQRNFRRQAILMAASAASMPTIAPSRSRIAIYIIVAFMIIAALLLGSHLSSLVVVDVQAAVRFEVKLAEESSAPGLREAKVLGSDRSIYLHEETIVTNTDIAQARIIEGGGPSQFGVGVVFNAAGAQKMRAATEKHVGRPVAILVDGQVVVAPLIRTPIGASAVVNGNYTRAQADRIVGGIGIR